MTEKQKQIIDYTPATTLATGDKLLLQKADGSTMNVDYAELARNIITQYNAQTLAGSAQSVQSAINIVNNKANAITSKLAWHNLGTISSIDALNTALGNLVSGETGISANSHVYYFWFTTSTSFLPFSLNGSIFIGEMTVAGGERYNVLVQNHGDIGNFFRGTCLKGTWTWVKLPSRAEFDALNSNIEKRAMGSQATYIPNGADLDTYLTFGLYCSGSANVSATLSHAPITVAGFLLEVKRTSNSDTVLVQEALVNGNVMQKFKRWHSSNGWTDWIEEPNRSEITALNNSLYGDALPTNTDINSVITVGTYACYGSNTYTNLPSGVTYGTLQVIKHAKSTSWITQILYVGGTSEYRRNSTNGGTSWGAWTLVPTRAEVDALNSNLWKTIPVGSYTDFNDFPDGTEIWANNSSGRFTNAPSQSGYHVFTMLSTPGYKYQRALQFQSHVEFVRTSIDGTWGEWVKFPARSEVDALNNRFVNLVASPNTVHTVTVPNSSRHFIIATGGGAQAYWIGYVYTSGSGALTIVEVAKGTLISNVSSGSANKLTITFTSSLELRLADITVNGNPMSLSS